MTFEPHFFGEAFLGIAGALPLTLFLTLAAMINGFVIGLAVAIIRLRKPAVIRPLAEFYVSFTRGTPVVLHLFIVYLGLPMLLDTLADHYGWGFRSKDIPLFVLVAAALSLTAGAYMSEIIRSGILAVPGGQLEAAYSVGMTTFQAVRRVIFPQAIGASVPGMCNLFVGILHGSSLAYMVSLMEINGMAMMLASKNWSYLEPLAAVALIYWAIVLVIERLAAVVEKRWKVYSAGGVAG
ncbi:amino acid ABC transporter permease [Paenibacillus filicis]|uniref:Amino acid ABC transporter permease n=1 Tax=Paenibacillus filicis TaxID=669464 RepID=A0ABU9DM32_9BACL